MIRVLLAVIVIAATVTGTQACPNPARDGRPGWNGDHVLLGRAFSAGTHLGRVVERAGGGCDVGFTIVANRVKAGLRGGVVILGEIHDNPEHHWWRGALLDHLRQDGVPPPAVVTEHLKAGTPVPTSFPGPRPADDFFAAVRWSESGWPDAAMFEPLYRPLLGHFAIVPGDPPAGRVAAVARSGLAALSDEERTRLSDRYGLSTPLPAALESALLDELEASHCGLVPRDRFATMAVAQRYRDAHLADATERSRSAEAGVVLLTGNGHARADRGVPAYLEHATPGRSVTAVLLLEVEEGRTDPATYVTTSPEGRRPADIIVFTPRAARVDPCIAMRARLLKSP
jgi:uncharacterized iron-regulated protein